MTDQLPRPAPAADLLIDSAPLHLAGPEDRADVADRDQRFAEVLARGDERDRAAERRDRSAEAAEAAGRPHVGWIDRSWAGRDRDQAAADRADLIALLQERALSDSAAAETLIGQEDMNSR